MQVTTGGAISGQINYGSFRSVWGKIDCNSQRHLTVPAPSVLEGLDPSQAAWMLPRAITTQTP